MFQNISRLISLYLVVNSTNTILTPNMEIRYTKIDQSLLNNSTTNIPLQKGYFSLTNFPSHLDKNLIKEVRKL